jgi:transcription-repair coupling factor (superfamily II helicase)
MSVFQTLSNSLTHWAKKPSKQLEWVGVSAEHWATIATFIIRKEELPWKNFIFVVQDSERADMIYHALRINLPTAQILHFPGLEISPYGGILSHESNLYKRFYALNAFLNSAQETRIMVATSEALTLRIPKQDFFHQNSFTIGLEDIIPPLELAKKLVELGYSQNSSADSAGSFSHRGEIFDIHPTYGPPVRLHYFDDLIETISEIEPESLRTLKDKGLTELTITPAPHIFTRSDFSSRLRENVPQPGPRFREKFEHRKRIFEQLSNGFLFENYPAFVPLFFETTTTILEYFSDYLLVEVGSREGQEEIDHLRESLSAEYKSVTDSDSTCILPGPEFLYDFNALNNFDGKRLSLNSVDISSTSSDNSIGDKLSLHFEDLRTMLTRKQMVASGTARPEFLKSLLSWLSENPHATTSILFCFSSQSSKDEFEYLLNSFEGLEEIRHRVQFVEVKIPGSFYYEAERLLIISDSDIFSQKVEKTRKKRHADMDLFAEQLATLKVGDYVIHKQFGLGVYLGLDSLDMGGQRTDYLQIKYAEGDKVYVPVYKLSEIQKHADAASELKPDTLRNNKFAQARSRARASVKALAFDLLRLEAEREMTKAHACSPPEHLYKEFELDFPFQETEDQLATIDEVIQDLQSEKPMDRLVCGDVGFGKTEVAMRAAFKCVLDKKQVAILVPTTVLALQHYNSFINRFKNFPITIEFLSRFKSPKESKEIVEKLKKGEIDIVIGTHKILSKDIAFSDLGLVVVDEEQRFGVGHKEKLKLLKKNVHYLTLTATPIPRTLQMAFLGVRKFSIIKTAPPKKQSIKTYVVKDDDLVLQTALKKELDRGGQAFVVHNRVQDIESYAARIRELVPEASIIIAHGQMGEGELEKRITAFFKGEYQILISTTIIESGIDIPNANTMIIDRSDTFGLAQLHQLRGRIGRSDKRAYAYFVIPNSRGLTEIAEKRLKAIQTYADMGSGFAIASADLEIRGAGDILGGEQSGHIERIGLELYMELLREAIKELKGERSSQNRALEISTPFEAFIPNDYVTDAAERLRSYKRLSNAENATGIDAIYDEICDLYGPAPERFKNLVSILKSRLYFIELGLSSVQATPKSLVLQFDKEILGANDNFRNKVVEFFISKPKLYQFSPDFRVHCFPKGSIGPNELLSFAKDIAEQILPC